MYNCFVNESNSKTKLIPNGGYPMHRFVDVKAAASLYISKPESMKLIEDAYLFAKEKHEGLVRRSGEPYIQHPIEVAFILAQLQTGPETIAAGFLHDVVEDTDATIEDIRKRFGADVAFIVDSLTKIQRMKLSHRTESDFEAEDHRKIFLGMARDIRVILIKLADRLHNMRTLAALKPERQLALSRETLDVFTPIAHRLGIYTIQSELEDLSLKYLEPEKYATIEKLLNERATHRKDSLEALQKRIADILFERKIPFRIESRVKSIYSIYRKMFLKNHDFDEIYDVLAVRIITATELNCYEILGIIHSTYKPVPGRFKDYIAMPKPNMYQSLHTTILAGDGNIYEIQIRTEEMDSVAETGVAAHWKYKETGYNAREEQRDIEEKLHWFRDLVSISEDEEDAKSYMTALSNDIFNANVYVFTPMGKVIELPQKATILDFAYKIHTKVGDQAVGAVVNGNFVPLNTELKTGDVCEIRTAKTAPGPNERWLDYVVTNGARTHIRRFLNAKHEEIMAEENIRKGRESASDAFKMADIDEAEMERLLSQSKVFNEYHVDSLDELYKAIAARKPTAGAVLDFLGIKRKPTTPKILKKNPQVEDKNPVYVEGVTNIAITLGKCCTPVPGDPIVGFITRGKGITVHRADCSNVRGHEERLLPVHWKEDLGGSAYPAAISVRAADRPNLVADILNTMAMRSIPVSDMRARLVGQTGEVLVTMTCYLKSASVLDDLYAAIKAVNGVRECRRLTH